MTALKNPVQMAVIGAAHGIKGELRVKSFTGDPLALAEYGPLFAKDGRKFSIIDIRPANNVVVVRFKGVQDRNAAETLIGTELFVERSTLPDDGDQDEFYHADLVGLKVRDDTGTEIGRVTAVQNFGGGDLLEIALSGRHEVLVPFSAAAVPEVSVAAGYVRIDPVAAGLVDTDDSDIEGAPVRPGQKGRGFDAKQRPRGPADAGGNR
ncbi:ribosome maturation factor RimM [Arvimicrobium flavum]|uniref:ribosome maturation factor RimM n=1 Tax=Arvimicrobium flavum TaxID=3393320 RepID=UPI00237B86D8|nr:ribosome maturation factor RimM [Mesorhizobium shangrilense]